MDNAFKIKSFAFAIRIVKLCSYLKETKNEFILSQQLLRSGTAIGALHREAEYAESKKDFIHKLGIAQKECNETLYWIELLKATEIINEDQFESIYNDCNELMALLISILTTAKKNINK